VREVGLVEPKVCSDDVGGIDADRSTSTIWSSCSARMRPTSTKLDHGSTATLDGWSIW
jgi:hypothetical protein